MKSVWAFSDVIFAFSVPQLQELSKQNPPLRVQEDVLRSVPIVFKILEIVRLSEAQIVL